MLQYWKKLTAGMLVIVMLAACLAGCVSDDNPDPTTGPTQITTQATTQESTTGHTEPSATETEPSTTETEPGTGETLVIPAPLNAEPEQLRLDGYNAGWVNRFVGEYGAYKLVNDTQQLAELLSAITGMGKNVTLPETYNEAFFDQYRLVLVPMQSASGSVRYEVETSFNGELITITLTAKMPEAGTADMADWLVLVPLARNAYPEGVQIDLLANQSPVGNGNLNIQDS